jgi:undecaprenyl-phosphate galactose phosphotransferase
MNCKRIFAGITLFFSDIITITVSYLLAYLVRAYLMPLIFRGTSAFTFPIFISRSYLLLPFLLIFAYEGLYHRRIDFWTEARLLWKGNFLATVLILIYLYITKFLLEWWFIVVLAFILNFLALPLIRNTVKKKILLDLGCLKENLLFIGSAEGKEELIKVLARNPTVGYTLGEAIIVNNELSLNLDELFSKNPRIYGIVIEARTLSPNIIEEIYQKLEKKVKHFYVIPGVPQLQTLGAEILPIESTLFIKYPYNLLRLESRLTKRALDIIIALIALIITFPVSIITAILVKLSSPGPVFFRQARLGKNQKLFDCIKFRTMYQDAEVRLSEVINRSEEIRRKWEKYLKIENDPRITKVGRILRRASLDELPQLWNVLLGEMSLIGPRPYLPHEVTNYGSEMKIISKVKPGITGLWQVSGRSQLTFEERLRLDVFYVKNWSLWLDLVIMIKTIIVWFKGEGAY